MAERGGVGTRLYVAGGTEVRREFDSTGDAGKRMFAQIAAGEKTASPGLKVVSRSVQELREGVVNLAGETGGVGRIMGAFGTGGVLAAAGIGAVIVAMQRFGGAAAEAARDAAELDSAIGFTFGKSADSIRAWGDETGRALGRASTDLQKSAMDFQTLFGPAAASEGQAVEMSKQFAQLAQDIGSFRNIAADTVSQNLVSGLVGETEPLRKFGVIINAAAVETKAYEMGLVKAGEEVDDYGKILARAALILEQTKTAQGDLARTSESATNVMVASKAATKELAQEFGESLNPALAATAGWWTEVAHGITDALKKFKEWRAETSTESRFSAESLRRLPGVGGDMARFFLGAPGQVKYADNFGADDLDPDQLRYAEIAGRGKPRGPRSYVAAGSGSGRAKRAPAAKARPEAFQGAVSNPNDPRAGQNWDLLPDTKTVTIDIDAERSFQRLNERFDEAAARLEDGIGDGLRAAFSGDIGSFITNKLMSWAMDGLGSTLAGALRGAAGGGGWMSTVANAAINVFTRHAAGGTEWAGDRTSKAEFGPELSISGRTGQVFDADTTARILGMAGGQGGGGGGGHTIHFAPVINAPGADRQGLAEVRGELRQLAASIPDVIDQRAGPSAHDYLQRAHVLPQSY